MMDDEIKQYAIQIGFDEVGVARATPAFFHSYEKWIRNGYHGEMDYLARRIEQRRNPELLLENVRSIITVARRYSSIQKIHPSTDQPFTPLVSRYACGEDYHEVLREGLNRLTQFIRERTDGMHQARGCVDSAPMLERDFASQAGIGWIGKHTNLLNRTLGNWFFLGAVLTTLELAPTMPVPSRCGTCTRCLDVCPTRAFVSPYVLDARRCISYLTIELKGPIPRELRAPMGLHIFGCDDCLEVCPWNRFALPCFDPRFHPRTVLQMNDLIALMKLTPEEFRRKFKGSPILRAKRRGFLRNVAVALGNTHQPKAVPVLLEALHDPEILIRGHAAWALGEIGGKEAQEKLLQTLPTEREPWVCNEIQEALHRFQKK